MNPPYTNFSRGKRLTFIGAFGHQQFPVKKEIPQYNRNSWVSDITIDKKNIPMLVKAGRARWKIENETFNTLKNQGYHLEHNFGHGHKNLSMIFFMINLLASYVHQILDLTDPLYHKVRYTKFTSRKEFWNQLRCTIRILIFPHWQRLMQFICHYLNLRNNTNMLWIS